MARFKVALLTPVGNVEGDSVRRVVRNASRELGVTYDGVKDGIVLYSERNSSGRHHANLISYINKGDFEGLQTRLKADKDDVSNLTPSDKTRSVNTLNQFFRFYENFWFKKVNHDGTFVLTQAGKDKKNAVNQS